MKTIIGFLFLLITPIAVHAQKGRLAVIGEPAAIGLGYTSAAIGWGVGAEVLAGPQFGVNVNGSIGNGANRWASAFVNLTYRSASGLGMTLSPIGAAVVVGDDYSQVYPSAQLGAAYGKGRIALGTFMRVSRIPTADSKAEYWAEWVPVRISYLITL